VILALFVYTPVDHRDLHSFPTRRSSDLLRSDTGHDVLRTRPGLRCSGGGAGDSHVSTRSVRTPSGPLPLLVGWSINAQSGRKTRSEEHTSELQSRENLVCRLLLEKKNQ